MSHFQLLQRQQQQQQPMAILNPQQYALAAQQQQLGKLNLLMAGFKSRLIPGKLECVLMFCEES